MTTKYLLAKDLPFAKKGDELIFGYGDTITVKDPQNDSQRLYICRKNELDEMIKQGWIKEVKPREVWMNESEDGIFYDSISEAKRYAGSGVNRQIKFIEVLDVE